MQTVSHGNVLVVDPDNISLLLEEYWMHADGIARQCFSS
jgi:hypothetical protein